MQTSENIDQLAMALAKAQTEIEGAAKDAKNDHFRSKYATLSSVWEAWQKVGPKNDLAMFQVTDIGDKGPVLVTRIAHKSGQWVEGRYPLRPVKDDPQGFMSALTYARRGALSAMVGIAPEDDDGNAASERTPPAKPVQTAAPKVEPPKAKSPQALAAEWVAKAKQDISEMVSADDVDGFVRDNARFVESLGKYPELEAEFDQFVKDAINSKPSSLEAA